MKKTVCEKVDVLDTMGFDDKKVQDVVDELLALKNKYNSVGEPFLKLEYFPWTDGFRVNVVIEREETDKEYADRLSLEERQKKTKDYRKKKQELAILARLKKKYERKE